MNQTRTNRTSQGSIVAIALTGLLFVALMSGCATTRPADFMANEFDCANVEDVVVLPVLDFRVDQSTQLDLDELVLPRAEYNLEKRGYSYTVERDRSLLLNISLDDLEAPTQNFITSLPPDQARWVLVLALDELLTEGVFFGAVNVEMSGYLFDKENGQLAWRNREIIRTGSGGLMWMMLKDSMSLDAIARTTNLVLWALPERKK